MVMELTMEEVEKKHLVEFQRFYHSLSNKKDIFYLFFSNGLLHWALKSLEFVPESVNLVLIGSSLTLEEKNIAEATGRPFHNIELDADDKTVWDFLFATNEYSFGWLDSDCFVLNSEIFSELADINPDAAINYTWYHELDSTITTHKEAKYIGRTHLMFVNVPLIRSMQKMGVDVSACTYNYEGSRVGRTYLRAEYAKSRSLRERERALLSTVLNVNDAGLPVYPLPGFQFFDTTFVYQLLAISLGYRLNPTRKIRNGCTSELLHIGGVSYYRRWKKDDRLIQSYKHALLLNILALEETSAPVSKAYIDLLEQLRFEYKQLSGDRISDMKTLIEVSMLGNEFTDVVNSDERLRFLKIN
jgi:hypothetical protein